MHLSPCKYAVRLSEGVFGKDRPQARTDVVVGLLHTVECRTYIGSRPQEVHVTELPAGQSQ